MRQRISVTTRYLVAAMLLASGVAYCILLIGTYFQTAAPNRLWPNLDDLDRLLFLQVRPVSPMERRLVMSDTPLGTGPLITGQTMDKIAALTDVELAQREGERQALLDWIRSGASRMAYERDDHLLSDEARSASITPDFLGEGGDDNAGCLTSRHVRIRSLIHDRCLSCHDEEGDDTARLIPFDSYEAIARYLVPESHGDRGRSWLLAALALLFPFGGMSGLAFGLTNHPRHSRTAVLAVSISSLAAVAVCWFVGSAVTPVLFAAAAVAVICSVLQILAGTLELLGIQRRAARLDHVPPMLCRWRDSKILIER